MASSCIQGTVHYYYEQSEIQQDPPDAWIARDVSSYHHHCQGCQD